MSRIDGVNQAKPVATSRRAALARLGLAVGAAYAAPTLLQLDRAAQAGASRSCGKGKGGFTPPGNQPACPN
jgi:hypothetical protein